MTRRPQALCHTRDINEKSECVRDFDNRRLLATDLIILNPIQVTGMTPELPPSSLNYHINRRALSLDRLNVHRPPLHGKSSKAPGLTPTTLRPLIRYHNY
ncbi:hypothetical protein TNCV_78101 [Trichonephila clavipes]|nr:hypothetical protein TNCV_78101 [Trichonephila clavipes]